MSKKLDNSDHQKMIQISSFSKELLLIVFGALIGVLTNQVFFRENKDYEMKVELKKDILKEQYQYLNRILQFTHRYELTTTIFNEVIKTVEEGTNKIISIDTIKNSLPNPKQTVLPSFIVKDEKRLKFIQDIEFIKSNKDKIDHEVYSKFEELLEIIKENPIPKNSDENELTKSTWNNPSVQLKWQKNTTELYYLTYNKLY